MQTILGAGGAIGNELAKVLPRYSDKVRLVSRNPEKVNPGDETFAADLMDSAAVNNAVMGSEVVYLTAGLPYDIKIWTKCWPQIMQNVIGACKKQGCKLVFFDNIYMYDPKYMGYMTEETPMHPTSKKGKVRAELVNMLMEEVDKGNLRALIARSADFYGPGSQNTSVLAQTVIQPLSEGKPANWLGSTHFKHSYTYTPDAGKATALLGNTDDAYGQVWHLPTAENPPTGREWIEKIAGELNVKPKFRAAPKLVIRAMGLFMPIMKEMVEMMYQYDRDYVFIGEKFENKFNTKPTPYDQGIKTVIQSDYK